MSQADIDQIFKIFFESGTLDDFSFKILELIKDNESVCSRLLLYDPTIKEIYKTFPLGTKSDTYAYLDGEIIQQLQDRQKLFIPDSSKYRAIKFTPGKPYPKSILGFSSKLDIKNYLFFWQAFDKEKDLKKSEVDWYESAIKTLCAGIKKMSDSMDVNKKSNYQELVINKIREPIIVSNKSYEPIYMNEAGKKFLATYKNESESGTKKTILENLELKKDRIHTANGNHFRIEYYEIINTPEKDLIKLFLLTDQSKITNQNKTIRMIVEISNQTLRSKIIENLGFAKMLPLIGELNKKQAEYSEKIKANSEKILSEIDDLFSYMRITQDNGLIIDENKVFTLVQDSIELNRAEALKNRVKFEVSIKNIEDEVILCDVALMRHVFYELIKFSLQQTGLGRSVKIVSTKSDGGISIAINDSGNGFSPLDIDHFPYGNFQNKKMEDLILIWKILNLQGFDLSISSRLGEGSEYTISFTQKEI